MQLKIDVLFFEGDPVRQYLHYYLINPAIHETTSLCLMAKQLSASALRHATGITEGTLWYSFGVTRWKPRFDAAFWLYRLYKHSHNIFYETKRFAGLSRTSNQATVSLFVEAAVANLLLHFCSYFRMWIFYLKNSAVPLRDAINTALKCKIHWLNWAY